MIRLVNVYHNNKIREGASKFLYELMKERQPEINISHKELPSFEKHCAFIISHPYRGWYLIELYQTKPVWLGYISATHNNEIGIVLRQEYRGLGYGTEAVNALMEMYRPNVPNPSVRRGQWLANIAPGNVPSRTMFENLGFRKIQETFALEENDGYQSQVSSTAA